MEKTLGAFIGCLAVIVIWAGLGLFLAWCVEWAWNTLAPLFHGPSINFAEALAGYFLISLIVNGFRMVINAKSS